MSVPRAYTTRLLLFANLNGTVTYQVPAGKRVVLRNLHGVTDGTAATSALLEIAGIYVAAHSWAASPGQYQSFDWEGRAVAYAGETISLIGFGHLYGTVSGYLFDDP